MLQIHKTLQEAIRNNFVIRRPENYEISNTYLDWCTKNAKPYIVIETSRKYSKVEIDLYETSIYGFDNESKKKIWKVFSSRHLKLGSSLSIGSICSWAYVLNEEAIEVAKFLYDLASEQKVSKTIEELNKERLENAKNGFYPMKKNTLSVITFNVCNATINGIQSDINKIIGKEYIEYN